MKRKRRNPSSRIITRDIDEENLDDTITTKEDTNLSNTESDSDNSISTTIPPTQRSRMSSRLEGRAPIIIV
jgi:hypothetical protein